MTNEATTPSGQPLGISHNPSKSGAMFTKFKAENKPAFIGYLPYGFPNPDVSLDAFKTMGEHGVDAVEIGLPYSDPVMDGPVIQAAASIALNNGETIKRVFEAVETVANAGGVPLIMSYWNLVYHYGVERFARDFEEQVAWLCAHANRSVVAALMRIDWKSVGGICKRACDRLEAEAGSRFGNLLRIGIDETSCKKGRKHMVVVPDHDAGRAVWCGKERGKKTSRSFFDLLACSLVALVLPTGEGLDKWLARACRSHNSKVKELSKKIRRHKDAIACSVELGISNARVEAVNDKIKLTVRMGYGFRNFDNLIALVMLRCSNLPITLPGRTQAA